jgi:hypothetical protein
LIVSNVPHGPTPPQILHPTCSARDDDSTLYREIITRDEIEVKLTFQVGEQIFEYISKRVTGSSPADALTPIEEEEEVSAIVEATDKDIWGQSQRE